MTELGGNRGLTVAFALIGFFSFFKECPHPDEKQRSDLSKRLGLENKQVKFWFQNRRTQMKVNLKTKVLLHLYVFC